jgi:hypothetical protein
MKLSSREIATIEGLFTKIEDGMNITEVAAFYGLGKHGKQSLSTTLCCLERLGLTVPNRMKRGDHLAREMAEFREWKAARAAASATSTTRHAVNVPITNGHYTVDFR